MASQQFTAILTNQHTISLIKDELSELSTIIYNTSFQIEGNIRLIIYQFPFDTNLIYFRCGH